MESIKNKFTLILTAGIYLLCHLRIGNQLVDTITGTLYQMLLTAPYALGFGYIIMFLFKKLSGAEKVPLDRYLRVFFTIAILFALFFALYEYAGGNKRPEGQRINLPFLSNSVQGDSLKGQ